MRGVIVGIVIFIVMITGMLFYLKVLEKSTDGVLELVDGTYEAVSRESWEEASGRAEQMHAQWRENMVWMAAFIAVNKTENILISTANINEYVKRRDTEEVLSELARLRILIEQMRKSEYPLLRNVI